MKGLTHTFLVLGGLALLAAGCGKSGNGQTSATESTPTATTTNRTAAGQSAHSATQTTQAVAQAAQGPTNLAGWLMNSVKNKKDEVLKSLSGDLNAKMADLARSLRSAAPQTKSQLDHALKSFVNGHDLATLTNMEQVAAAKLTDAQKQLAQQVKRLTDAYVAQKHLATLAGAQAKVKQMVTALRKGETEAAATIVQELRSNPTVSGLQKDLLDAIARGLPAVVKPATNSVPPGPPVPPSPPALPSTTNSAK